MNIEIEPHLQVEYSQSGVGAPLVFLHAFPLNYEMWQEQIERFEDGYNVLAPNARGFGGTSPFSNTPADGPPSIAQMSHDLNNLLDALNIKEPIILCGLSMGGYTALHFALKYSSRVRALILCDTRAQSDDDETKAARDANIKIVHERGSWTLADKLTQTLLGKSTIENNPELVLKVGEMAGAQQVSTLTSALEALRDRPDVTENLAKISVPTLLIFGEEDALAPPFVKETLKNNIPNSQLEIIPRAGHLPNLEQPGKFNARVLEFLNGLD